jgi:two-component system, NarL family, nitrate/nitrite response regulator NarL
VAVIDLDGGQGDLPARVAARYPNAAHVLLVDGPDGYRPPSGAAAGRPWAALLKDAGADELAAAVRAVSRGLVVLDPAVAARLTESGAAFAREGDPLDEPLTEREAEVLHLVALGLPNKTIAQRLGISEHTAKFHVGSILAKLGAASRTEAVALAARRGVLVL